MWPHTERRKQDDQQLNRIERKLDNMSTILAAIQSADTQLAAAVAQNVTDNKAILADVQTLLANAANNPDPVAAQAAITDIQAQISTIQANNTALESALVPPVTPAAAAKRAV